MEKENNNINEVTVEPFTQEEEDRILKQAVEREGDLFKLTPGQEKTLRRAAGLVVKDTTQSKEGDL